MLNEIMDCMALAQIEAQKGKEGKKALKFKDGWIFSLTFHHFQKRKDEVYVYITPCLFGTWKAQAYPKKGRGICALEAQIHDPSEIEKLFDLSEKWLEKYHQGLDGIENDPYYPFYKDGWKGRDITHQELFY